MTEIFALKPNRDLLDSKFEGYKLSLDKLPIHSKDLDKGVLEAAHSASGDFSYQQVRLFTLHNHLIADPWNQDSVYYFSSDGSIHLIGSTSESGTLNRSATVLQLPDSPASRTDLAAHPSLSLTSPDLALVSDGHGVLHVVATGDRSEAQPWQIKFSCSPLEGCGFVLLYSKLDKDGGLHLLTIHVTAAKSIPEWKPDPDDKDTLFINVLSWLTFVQDGDQWRQTRLRQAVTSGTVHYAALDVTGPPEQHALCVAAENTVHYIRDSEKPIRPAAVEAEPVSDSASAEKTTSRKPPLYVWTQTDDEVTVLMNFGTDSTLAEKPRVALELQTISVTSGDQQAVLTGQLGGKIKLDESTWTLDTKEPGKLEILLCKAESGTSWSDLVVGDIRGEEAADPETAARLAETLALLTSHTLNANPDKEDAFGGADTTEECDEFPAESAAIVRLDGETHSVSHQCSLGSHQYILTTQLSADALPALCVRHDVDALLWQPETKDGKWQCEHVATLNALGFVQASKQQRKFSVCPPDTSYAVICDTSRHIYIYHQPSPVEGDLRNRKTGQRIAQVSRQQVVTLEDTEPILGVAASNRCLYVLTAGHLHCLAVHQQ